VAWRSALQTASRVGEWSLTKLAGEAMPGDDSPRGLVVLLRDGAQALALASQLDAVAIIAEPLDVVCNALGGLYPGKNSKAYAVAAERLAAAIMLERQGAQIIAGDLLIADFPFIGSVSRKFAEEPRQLVTLDTAPLAIYANGKLDPGVQIPWDWSVFSFNTTPRSQAVPPEIDLTGRSRVLFYGPRFNMPAGEWSVRLKFWLDPEGSVSQLRFEWGARDDFETLDLQLDNVGYYEVQLSKRLDRVGALELRAWVTTGHFAGAMRVADASLVYNGI